MKNIYSLNTNQIFDNIIWGNIIAPAYAYLEVTNRCDGKCLYCQVSNTKDMDMENSLFTLCVDHLSKLGVFEVRLGGGEPLLNENLEDKISYLTEKGFVSWICTNGHMLSLNKAFNLKRRGLFGVRISLDSLIPRNHNHVRGKKDSWTRAVNAMMNAKLAGLFVCISMTIGEHNYDEIEKMKIFCLANDFLFLTHSIMPIGKGKEFLNSTNRNILLSKENKKVVEATLGERECGAGTLMIAIDIEGYVSACTFAKRTLNLKELPLREIMEQKEFKKYTKLTGDFCKQCDIIHNDSDCLLSLVCRGGCWVLKDE